MVDILRSAHSGIRWIVLLLIVIVLIKYLIGWISKSEFTRLDNQLWLGLINSVRLQLVLGLILLIISIVNVGMVRQFLEHGVTNIIVVGLLEGLGGRFRRIEDGPTKHRNLFFLVLVADILIYVAVASILGFDWLLNLR